jgi:excisionase family DNA binding protein
MTNLKCLTTKGVARLCRVSDATVKRWAEAGLLQAERTSGGHRRFRAEEVARFQRDQVLGLKQTHGDDSITSAASRRRDNKNHSDCALFHSLIVGCEEAAANILVNAYLNGKSLTKIFDDLVCPAMRRIGELWFAGEISITQEHLATRTAHNAIYKLRNALPVPKMSGALAMGCSLEGDFHELPTYLAQISIENEGLEVVNFGANTPLYSLADEVLQYLPVLVCISVTILTDIERLSRDYINFTEQISKHKTPVVMGGAVFRDERVRRRFPAGLYARSFTELAEYTRNLIKTN